MTCGLKFAVEFNNDQTLCIQGDVRYLVFIPSVRFYRGRSHWGLEGLGVESLGIELFGSGV